MSERIPELKAWDDGTAVMEKNCVPVWHLGCAAINALEAALAERDRMLRMAIEDGLPNFSRDDMEDCSLMASRIADLRARAKEGAAMKAH